MEAVEISINFNPFIPSNFDDINSAISFIRSHKLEEVPNTRIKQGGLEWDNF